MKVKVDQPKTSATSEEKSNDEAAKTSAPASSEKAPAREVKRTGDEITFTLRDSRLVTVRKMGPLARMRMCGIIGPEKSKNEIYLQSAIPAYCTTKLEGQDVPPPQKDFALEAFADRLGDEALLEIMLTMTEEFGTGNMQQILDEYTKRQEIKNL